MMNGANANYLSLSLWEERVYISDTLCLRERTIATNQCTLPLDVCTLNTVYITILSALQMLPAGVMFLKLIDQQIDGVQSVTVVAQKSAIELRIATVKLFPIGLLDG